MQASTDPSIPPDNSSIELAARKVGASCHIGFNGAFYSVPSYLYKQMVFVRASDASVDILNYYGDLVASHKRCHRKGQYITKPSHMPSFYLSDINSSCYDGAELRRWAKSIGDNTFFVIDLMLNKRQFEQQSYKLCMAILQLSKKYGVRQLESTCKSVRLASACNYSAIKKILSKNKVLDI